MLLVVFEKMTTQLDSTTEPPLRHLLIDEPVECLIAKTVLLDAGVAQEHLLNDIETTMQTHLDICDVNLLGKYKVRWNRAGIVFVNAMPYKGFKNMKEVLE